ncbi:MAG: type I DNA topoisomerase [Phycisphaeraceae bacterium]|nr:type I DNA topoisomerase [Phycisphaeraceae bacterium]
MARKVAKKTSKKTARKSSGPGASDDAGGVAVAERKPGTRAGAKGGGRGRRGPGSGLGYKAGAASGKDLVIVESPSKAKTINKYLGADKYVVLASVGHIRDLPSKAPKGDKSPVPGVDLGTERNRRFTPTYQVMEGKENVLKDLKRAAKDSLSSGGTVWFATDLDREGEAIAWHLAQELGITPAQARRVMFAAITKQEIQRAFGNPHPIDEDKVNAQQARRILDRIVGYQVSPLLWKKVARGLSAGRVQSVAVRLVVEREREIRAFVPDEEWSIEALFALSAGEAAKLGPGWVAFLGARDDKGNPPTRKSQTQWVSEHKAIRAELIEVDGRKFEPRIGVDAIIGPADDVSLEGVKGRLAKADGAFGDAGSYDLTPEVGSVAARCGMVDIKTTAARDETGRGPARWKRTITGRMDPATPYRVRSIETKRSTVRPPPPFITSTLQQAASSRLGFNAQRAMRAAQQLYEGVDIPGEGPVGLITYMRTDSTHISGEALGMARDFVQNEYGQRYLPEKPNFFTSSNKDAQEAHEAIRPTSLAYPPSRVRSALSGDQFRLYQIIWERFVACQMVPAEWDATTVLIEGGSETAKQRGSETGGTGSLVFKATGRVLAFDGFYKVSGVPTGGDTPTLPAIEQGRPLSPFAGDVEQRFTSPPSRYSEASLIKMLESEGIGRPSTYASIIQTIQDRKYVEQRDTRAFHATDLGEVVTLKLIEAFPGIMDVGYTREMETQLDKVEEDHLDWIEMLRRFYAPFKESLEAAEENLKHAKAEITPAPEQYKCPECGGGMAYRFGKNGRFMSCARFPDCKYACPVDREGRPVTAEFVDVACPECAGVMTRRTGRFGVFLGCARYNDKEQPCSGILNIDKKGHVTAPSQPPLETDLECEKCGRLLNLRNGIRGPWLGCSGFPKCRGRGKWAEQPDEKKKALESALARHEKAHPIPIIKTFTDGKALTDAKGKPASDAPPVEGLVLDGDPRKGD